MAKKKIKRVPLGKPLPPADDSEFDAEAMRAWGNNQALVHAEKHGAAVFNGMLGAVQDVDDATI